jgi:adenosylcobinamide-phosphate synthase
MDIGGLAPSVPLLLAAILLDAICGDPDVPLHPVRLLGRVLAASEKLLRNVGADGYAGGCALFAILAVIAAGIPSVLVGIASGVSPVAGYVGHVLLVYLCLAFRDLIDHVRRVEHAAARDDLAAARRAIANLVGRDTEKMDLAACCRAAIESLAENFVDGFLSVVFWYLLLGLPGMLLFKVVSTMDSMVGYRTPRYVRFGWCGARLDDLMNYVPARIAWLILGLAALPFRDLSALDGWKAGLRFHGVLPSPNSGWSEATLAGILRRRLVGPIWVGGSLVTDAWIGAPADPEGGSPGDIRRAFRAVIAAAAIVILLSVALGLA